MFLNLLPEEISTAKKIMYFSGQKTAKGIPQGTFSDKNSNQ